MRQRKSFQRHSTANMRTLTSTAPTDPSIIAVHEEVSVVLVQPKATSPGTGILMVSTEPCGEKSHRIIDHGDETR